MNDQLKRQNIFRHSLCWGGAMILCPIVMVVLDLFDKHTPNNIALFTSVSMMFLFVIRNAILSSSLQAATRNEATGNESDQ